MANRVDTSGGTLINTNRIFNDVFFSWRKMFSTGSLRWFWVRLPDSVNSLWPGDIIWCCRTFSSLVQVMACHWSVPIRYLTQWWLVHSWTLRSKLQRNLDKNTKCIENVICRSGLIELTQVSLDQNCCHSRQWINTLRPRQNVCHSAYNIFKIHFDVWKLLYSNSNFTEVSSYGSS